jgi:hypothetical protein
VQQRKSSGWNFGKTYEKAKNSGTGIGALSTGERHLYKIAWK